MLTNIVEGDKEIVIFLYQFFYKIPFITQILGFLSSIQVYLFGIFLGGYFLIALIAKNIQTMKLLGLYGVVTITSFGLGQFLSSLAPFRARPFVFLDIVPIIPHIDNPSFPSSHAIFFGISIIVLMRGFFPSYQKIILIFIGGIMCLSRIIGGIHYTSDILIGTIIGLLLGYSVFQIVSYMDSKFSITNHS